MRQIATSAAVFAALALLLPGLAGAQLREFRGKVDSINQNEVIIDNRQGDKLKFKPADDIVVQGEKNAYQQVSEGDWALVSWKMMDSPRVAYKIVVLPDQEEGEDLD